MGLNQTPLREVDANFVMISPQKGVLKIIPDRARAHGINFVCPKCTEKPHGFTLLFAQIDVPDHLKPHGRWAASADPIHSITLVQKIFAGPPCNWEGHIEKGVLNWG